MPASDPLTSERRTMLRHLSGRMWSAMRAELGTTGSVLPPTLWVCNDATIRFVRCRPFYRGPDAAAAIDGLRLVPRRDDDWAEFWAWERNDLGGSTPPLATTDHGLTSMNLLSVSRRLQPSS